MRLASRLIAFVVAIAAVTYVGVKQGFVLGFVVAVVLGAVGIVTQSQLAGELRVRLRRAATRLRKPTYAYDLLVRLECDREPTLNEVLDTSKKLARSIGARGFNYVQLNMERPPETITIEWHGSVDPVDVEEEKQDENEEMHPRLLISPVVTHVVALRELRADPNRTTELISAMWDLAQDLRNTFSGDAPEILITVNRLDGHAPRRPQPPSAHVHREATNGATVIRGSDALQIFATSLPDALHYLTRDVIDLEPVSS